VRITIAPGVELTEDELRQAPPFMDWAKHVGRQWRGTITVNYAERWEGQVVSLQVVIVADDHPRPAIAVLRSPTIDVLTTITNGSRWRRKKYCVFVEQYRPAAGCVVVSNPAGVCRWGEDPIDAIRREIWEDLDLHHLDFARFDPDYRIVGLTREPVVASPRVTSERSQLFRLTIEVRGRAFPRFLHLLEDRRTGVVVGGEQLRLRVVPIDEARIFIEAQPVLDAKALLSLDRARL